MMKIQFVLLALGLTSYAQTYESYNVAGMDILSVTSGGSQPHSKVVIMLHGGGGSGDNWRGLYEQGWFGNVPGVKFVFPTSTLPGGVWYNSFKNGCGFTQDCAYDIPSIERTGSEVAALVEHEKQLVSGNASLVFLGGFSQGAQLASYVQLAKLRYALGGVMVLAGYPLPPLVHMPSRSRTDAVQLASYSGGDMRWFIWHGANDGIFPATETMNTYRGALDALGVRSTLIVDHIEPGQGHDLQPSQFSRMVGFIHDLPVGAQTPAVEPMQGTSFPSGKNSNLSGNNIDHSKKEGNSPPEKNSGNANGGKYNSKGDSQGSWSDKGYYTYKSSGKQYGGKDSSQNGYGVKWSGKEDDSKSSTSYQTYGSQKDFASKYGSSWSGKDTYSKDTYSEPHSGRTSGKTYGAYGGKDTSSRSQKNKYGSTWSGKDSGRSSSTNASSDSSNYKSGPNKAEHKSTPREQDKSVHCSKWASQGFCSYEFVAGKCSKSCAVQVKDRDDRCPEWSEYCEHDWVQSTCPKTCTKD